MAHKPDAPSKRLRELRISILRDKVHHLGRVIAADKEAIDRAMEEFKFEPARRFRDRRAGRVTMWAPMASPGQ